MLFHLLTVLTDKEDAEAPEAPVEAAPKTPADNKKVDPLAFHAKKVQYLYQILRIYHFL